MVKIFYASQDLINIIPLNKKFFKLFYVYFSFNFISKLIGFVIQN